MNANSEQEVAATLIAIWRAAFDRWCNGDPSGFPEIYAPDATFFSPYSDGRIDGLEKMTPNLEKLRGTLPHKTYELINPKVQTIEKGAILTLSYITHGGEKDVRRNCTEVFRNEGDRWLDIHTHFS